MKFIITADIHAQEQTPIARTDNYISTLIAKIKYINNYMRNNKIKYWLDSGDLFTKWKSSPKLESLLYNNLPDNFITVAGNHDLPYHNIESYSESSLNLLETTNKIKVLKNGEIININGVKITGFSYSQEIQNNNADICISHLMVVDNVNDEKKLSALHGIKFLKKYDFEYTITGHNHKQFILTTKRGNRTLINPGSLMRRDITQKNYKPAFFILDFDNKELVKHFLPINDIIDDTHTKNKKTTDYNAFIEGLQTDGKQVNTFNENLEIYFRKHNIKNNIKTIINTMMGA